MHLLAGIPLVEEHSKIYSPIMEPKVDDSVNGHLLVPYSLN
jgi:hypothetical protein